MADISDAMTIEQSDDLGADFDAFSRIVQAMRSVDPERRARLYRAVAVFLGMEAHESVSRVGGVVSASSSYGSSVTATPTFSEDRTISPKEFLREKKPITDVERVVCLAYYLTHYRETPHFKTVDLSKLNTEAAQIKLSNAAQAVDNAAKGGLLVPASKGNKQLSDLGEQYVQALPDRAAAREAIAHGRPKRRPKRTRGNGTSMGANDGEE